MLKKSVFCSNCGIDIGFVSFCPSCGTSNIVKGTITHTGNLNNNKTNNNDTLISNTSSASDIAHYNSLQGSATNNRAVGGSVKTWRPATDKECAAQSDKMADKVMDLLATLPQIGSTKSHVVPNWQKGRVGATITTNEPATVTVTKTTANSMIVYTA